MPSLFGNIFIRHRVVVNDRTRKVHKATCKWAADAYYVTNDKVSRYTLDRLMSSRGWSPCGHCMGEYYQY